MSWILGIGGYSHDASAALLHDGRLIVAIQEERIVRIKHKGGFPYKAIEECLRYANISPKNITAIAFYTKKSNWDKLLFHMLKASLSNIRYTISDLNGFINSIGYRAYMSLNFRADLKRFFYETNFKKELFYDYDHHACHAAAGFYSSPFDEAIIIVIDSVGDGKTTSFWVGKENVIKEVQSSISFPHSIAHVYNRITKYLGFLSTGDEYKVMGLAAYGKPNYIDKLRNLIIFDDNGYRLNMEYFEYQYEYSLSKKFYEEFGPPRNKGDEINTHYADIASSMQLLFEEVLVHLVSGMKKKTGIKNLVITGGAALNCKANGKLLLSEVVDRVFVPPVLGPLNTIIIVEWGSPKPFLYKLMTGVLNTVKRKFLNKLNALVLNMKFCRILPLLQPN